MDSLEVEQWGDIARETSYCCPAASDSNTGAIRGRATVEVLASNADGGLAAARVIAVFVLLLQTRLDSLGDKISTYGLCQCSYGKRCQRTTRVVMQCGRLVAWILLLGGVTVLTIALSKWHKCTFLWALPRQTGLNRAALQFLFSFYVCLWHEYLLSTHGSVV